MLMFSLPSSPRPDKLQLYHAAQLHDLEETASAAASLLKAALADLLQLSCSSESARGQNAFQQEQISHVQKAPEASYLYKNT